jgi:hypothetical protein
MTKALETKVKKLTKELNQIKGIVKNLAIDVEAHSKTLEGDFMRASKSIKKGKKNTAKPSSSKPVKRDVNTDGWFCCVTCKLSDKNHLLKSSKLSKGLAKKKIEKWQKKFEKPDNKPSVRVFKFANAEPNAKEHKRLTQGKHVVKKYSVYLNSKK